MTETAPQTITAEGPTLEDALHQAAATLGVSPSQVEYKFDLAHFRSAAGRAMGVDTVRVFAWARQAPAAAPGAEVSRTWLETLLGHMGMKGEVLAHLSPSGPNRVSLQINSPDARFLVGRQGTTLQAIVELLEAAMAIQQPGWQFRLDIEGGQRAPREDDRGPRDDRGADRGPPRDDRGPPRDDRDAGPRGPRRDYEGRGRREDRGPDRGPPRDDRGPPRDDRGPPRGGRDDRGGSEDRRRTEQDLEKLRRLALRLAQEVARTGEPTEIHRELNSYERRVVHVAVSEVEGVASESVGDGTTKQVRILPTGRPAKVREEDLSDTPTQE